jgi:acyl-CoA-binding protein
MDLENEFKEAVDRSSSITQKPTNEELLKLYALYKQISEGDISGERPGGFDFKGAAKYDAWQELKGQDKIQCMSEYIQLVDFLIEKYND